MPRNHASPTALDHYHGDGGVDVAADDDVDDDDVASIDGRLAHAAMTSFHVVPHHRHRHHFDYCVSYDSDAGNP